MYNKQTGEVFMKKRCDIVVVRDENTIDEYYASYVIADLTNYTEQLPSTIKDLLNQRHVGGYYKSNNILSDLKIDCLKKYVLNKEGPDFYLAKRDIDYDSFLSTDEKKEIILGFLNSVLTFSYIQSTDYNALRDLSSMTARMMLNNTDTVSNYINRVLSQADETRELFDLVGFHLEKPKCKIIGSLFKH